MPKQLKGHKYEKNAAAVELGRKGGTARAKAMSRTRRVEVARKAAQSRWRKLRQS